MNRENGIYIAQCGFCHQGHLQFMRCHSCTTVVAVCDECELVWLDISAVKGEPAGSRDGRVSQVPGLPFQAALLVSVKSREIERTSLSALCGHFRRVTRVGAATAATG